jgi:hypothetical protein
MSLPDVLIMPLRRLDFRTAEQIMMQGGRQARRDPLLVPAVIMLPVCYRCESFGPLAPHRGKALCDPCRQLAQFRGW